MAKNTIPLDMIRVASPCQVSWDKMPGNEVVRFCPQCRNHVYNLSTMTRQQAETLIEQSEGRLCIRFYRRRDGTMMTRDCPLSPESLPRRIKRAIMATAIFFLMLGVGLPFMIAFGNSASHGTHRSAGLSSWTDLPPVCYVRDLFFPRPLMGTPCPPPAKVPPPGQGK